MKINQADNTERMPSKQEGIAEAFEQMNTIS